jgi:hypothetical protein
VKIDAHEGKLPVKVSTATLFHKTVLRLKTSTHIDEEISILEYRILIQTWAAP